MTHQLLMLLTIQRRYCFEEFVVIAAAAVRLAAWKLLFNQAAGSYSSYLLPYIELFWFASPSSALCTFVTLSFLSRTVYPTEYFTVYEPRNPVIDVIIHMKIVDRRILRL